MTDKPFDIQAIEDTSLEALGVALVKPALYWIGDEEAQISAFEDTGLRNTVWVHKDTQTRDSTIAYTDPTKNVKQYTLDMPVRVIPCYDTVRGKRIEWQIIGADVKLATIRPDSDPSIGSGGNVIQHSHQDNDEGGKLDASEIFNGGTVKVEFGGTNNDFIANPPTDGAMIAFNEGAERFDPVSFEFGGFLEGRDGATPESFTSEAQDETIRSNFEGSIYRWKRVKNNFNTSVNPSNVDDETAGYAKGSHWYNQSTLVLWFCKDPSTGAAVWDVWTLGLNKITVSASDPTTGDDETLGYGVNSPWFNTATKTLWICWDASTGAADWQPAGDTPLNNITNVDPTVSDDETLGYSFGSTWFNDSNLTVWFCADPITGDADWYEIGSYSFPVTRALNNTTSSTYSLDPTNYYLTVDASGGNITVELPPLSTVQGRQYVIRRIDSVLANTVTIDADGSDLINGLGSYLLTLQWQSATLLAFNDWGVIATA